MDLLFLSELLNTLLSLVLISKMATYIKALWGKKVLRPQSTETTSALE